MEESFNIQNSKSKIRYAGFWIRFLATWIDTAVLIVPLGFIVYILSGGEWLDFSDVTQSITLAQNGELLTALESMPKTSMKWEPLFELLIAGVTILFWKRWAGATPGKKVLGIHVVDAKTYEEINNKQAIIRYIGYIISTIPLAVGFLMVAFRKDRRALHDLLAETVVIYK
ncbi:MAG: RDD family protein [Helicobacteraceae bacterium]|nr:RDD family protein [Helicobacteraceae bacterium]